ncbi:MAG: hypothetical protein ACUVXH_12095 [Anaerolineae bacterium]
MTMDLTELAQTVGWLDESRRRDREQILQLQQRVESLTAGLQDLGRQHRELQARLSNAQAQLGKLAKFEEALANFKEEVKLLLQKHVEEQRQAAREVQSLRLRDQEAQARALDELHKQVQQLAGLREDVALARAEAERLHGGVQALRQDLDKLRRADEAQGKTLLFLEEQRRQDARRLADLVVEQTELLKRLEALDGRLTVAADAVQRAEERLSALWRTRDDLKAEQTRALEKLLLADQERERKAAQQARDWEAWAKRLEEFSARMVQFLEQFEEGRRMMARLEHLGEELRREQAQVAELQRLAEERQQKQFEEFQAEQDRRWRQETLRWEHQTEKQDKVMEEFRMRLADLEKHLQKVADQVRDLWELQDEWVAHQSAEMQRWLAEFNQWKAKRK